MDAGIRVFEITFKKSGPRWTSIGTSYLDGYFGVIIYSPKWESSIVGENRFDLRQSLNDTTNVGRNVTKIRNRGPCCRDCFTRTLNG